MLDYKNYSYSIWSGDYMSGDIILDTETDVQPFYTRAHQLVTFQAYNGKQAVFVLPEDVGWFLDLHKSSIFVIQRATFDVTVLIPYSSWEYWFYKIDNGLVRDTAILYTLLNLAVIGSTPKSESLKVICDVLLDRQIEKGQERVTFGQYLGKPFSEISEAHKRYAMDDVIHTHDAYNVLMRKIKMHDTEGTLLSHDIQIKGAIGLDQIFRNGIGFDQAQKKVVIDNLDKELNILAKKLSMWGWIKGKKGNKQVLFDVIKDLGFADKLPKTAKSKQMDTSKDALKSYTNYTFIKDYLRYQYLDKQGTFIRKIKDDRIHPQYKTIVNTGRTSCSGKSTNSCNFQQLPKVGGIKQCFIPKPGHVFVEIDYSALELVTLAQVLIKLYGHSDLAVTINSGLCPHVVTAGEIYGRKIGKGTKEEPGEVLDSERQFAKIANFGFPANMAPATFVDYCRGYGIDNMTIEESSRIKEGFKSAISEMEHYYYSMTGFADGTVKQWSEEKGIWEDRDTFLHTTLTGRKKARSTYTAYLNAGFQGLAADGAKLALYEIFKAGYTLVGFVHDSIVVEVPIEGAEQALKDVSNIMIDQMKVVTPDVRVGVEGKVTTVYGEKRAMFKLITSKL